MTSDPRRQVGGLGRGLAALIPQREPTEHPTEIALKDISRNPYQPRLRLEQEALERLAASIAEHGVIQPVLVTQTVHGYRLVAGERRVRAAEMAGLDRIPALVRRLEDQQQLALALVENLQRADLNALEEAHAYRRLMDEFGLHQEEVAKRVGRARSSVANTLRLLDLSPRVQEAISSGAISEGHGRAIGAVDDHERQAELLAVVVARGLSVRQTEELARRMKAAPSGTDKAAATSDPEVERIEAGLRTALATKVVVTPSRRGGRITIEYYDGDDLGRLFELLTGGVE